MSLHGRSARGDHGERCRAALEQDRRSSRWSPKPGPMPVVSLRTEAVPEASLGEIEPIVDLQQDVTSWVSPESRGQPIAWSRAVCRSLETG